MKTTRTSRADLRTPLYKVRLMRCAAARRPLCIGASFFFPLVLFCYFSFITSPAFVDLLRAMNIDLRGKRISELDFSSHNPATADPQEVAALRQIESIDASDNALRSLCRLHIFSSLTTLVLARNQLSGKVHGILCELPLRTLTSIDLSWNQLTDMAPTADGASFVTFAELPLLTTLDLSHNEITSPAYTPPHALLPPSLEVLRIGFNRVSTVGVFVRGCLNLRELHVASNKIGGIESGGLDVVAAECPALQVVSLAGNPIGAFLGDTFRDAVREVFGPSLCVLDGVEFDDANDEEAAPAASNDASLASDIAAQVRAQKGARRPQGQPGDTRSSNDDASRPSSSAAAPLSGAKQSLTNAFDDSLVNIGVGAARVRVVRSASRPADDDGDASSVLLRNSTFASQNNAQPTGRYGPRMAELNRLAATLTAAVAEAQAASQALLADNAALDLRLRDGRRHVAAQLRESAALKAERASLDANVAAMRLATQKTAAEVHHARAAADRQAASLGRSREATEPTPRGRSQQRLRPPSKTPARGASEEPTPSRTTRSAMKRYEATQRRLMQIEADQFFMPAQRFSYSRDPADAEAATRDLHPFDAAHMRQLQRSLYASPSQHRRAAPSHDVDEGEEYMEEQLRDESFEGDAAAEDYDAAARPASRDRSFVVDDDDRAYRLQPVRVAGVDASSERRSYGNFDDSAVLPSDISAMAPSARVSHSAARDLSERAAGVASSRPSSASALPYGGVANRLASASAMGAAAAVVNVPLSTTRPQLR